MKYMRKNQNYNSMKRKTKRLYKYKRLKVDGKNVVLVEWDMLVINTL